MRAPLQVRDICTSQMRKFDAEFICSSCREFRRPHLRYNVRRLERAANGKRGRALLELLAARRVCLLPMDVDLSPIEEACRCHLAGRPVEDAGLRKMIARVLARQI